MQRHVRAVAITLLVAMSGCGSSELSDSSSCEDFANASPADQVRWVRKTFDPDEQRDQFEFQGLMDAISGHCSSHPDDTLQALDDEEYLHENN